MEVFDKDGNPITLADVLAETQSIPKTRFDEVNGKWKTARDSLAQIQADAEAAKQAKLAEEGQFQELIRQKDAEIATLKGESQRIAGFESTMEGFLKSQIEAIPEKLRTLVPEGSVEDRFKWLSTNRALLEKPAAFDIGTSLIPNEGADDKNKKALSAGEKATAKRFGMTEEAYSKLKDDKPAEDERTNLIP